MGLRRASASRKPVDPIPRTWNKLARKSMRRLAEEVAPAQDSGTYLIKNSGIEGSRIGL